MAILGLILLGVCGVVGAAFVFNQAPALDAHVIGIGTLHFTVAGLFLIGAVTGLVFASGLGLFFGGLLRARRRAKQRRQRARRTRGGSLPPGDTRSATRLEQSRGARPGEDTPVFPPDGATGARRFERY